jgi:F-type H+-transporting ATPase subunit b|tara:strand:- start:19856 stop:20386 length:531 start_codon:yes stop_codon:yes gene_type:complete
LATEDLKKNNYMDPMSLVTPAVGLMFWTCVIFVLLILVLKKFAWKPILSAVDQRNESISNSLLAAEKARDEIASLTANNEQIIAQAKLDRDALLKEAREMKNEIISKAKETATNEADKIISSAKEQITNEKMKALTELKNQVAAISIEMAEKVLGSELSNADAQKDLVNRALKEKI